MTTVPKLRDRDSTTPNIDTCTTNHKITQM